MMPLHHEFTYRLMVCKDAVNLLNMPPAKVKPCLKLTKRDWVKYAE